MKMKWKTLLVALVAMLFIANSSYGQSSTPLSVNGGTAIISGSGPHHFTDAFIGSLPSGPWTNITVNVTQEMLNASQDQPWLGVDLAGSYTWGVSLNGTLIAQDTCVQLNDPGHYLFFIGKGSTTWNLDVLVNYVSDPRVGIDQVVTPTSPHVSQFPGSPPLISASSVVYLEISSIFASGNFGNELIMVNNGTFQSIGQDGTNYQISATGTYIHRVYYFGTPSYTHSVYFDVDITPATISVTGVTVSPTTLVKTVGDAAVTLTETVQPTNATDKTVTWTTSNASVATVTNGVVNFVGAGAATITVTTQDGSYTATCNVTVNAATVSVTGVTVSPTTLVKTVGDAAVTLTETVQPTNATNKTVTWTTSNASVATVTNGVVNFVGVGAATITVTTQDGNYTATCNVTVNAATVSVTGVTLNKNTTTISVGGNEDLTATVLPTNATNKTVSWSSNNTTVATVDGNGKVEGKTAGTAIITVTTQDGNYTASCTVTVSATTVAVTGVTLDLSSLTLSVGGERKLVATITPSNATNQNIAWTSSNTAVAKVEADGTVTALAAGTATITVTTQDGNKTATCAVTVEEEPPFATFKNLKDEYDRSNVPVPLKIEGKGSEKYTIIKVNGVVATEFVPNTEGIFEITGTTNSGDAWIEKYVKVKQ